MRDSEAKPSDAKPSDARPSDAKSPASVRSSCPECEGQLKVLRVIGGRAGSEYWTMRCTRCGGIHLDIVKGLSPSPSPAA
jgi:Zn finger protein HypA/HybF involved in hydrogenase expression